MYKVISTEVQIKGKVCLFNLGQQGLNDLGLPHGFIAANNLINQGDVIHTIHLTSDIVRDVNHWKAFQVDINKYVIDDVIEGVNHDCDPSAYFEPVYNGDNKIIAVNLIARRDIEPITERTKKNSHNVITFNYLTNEVDMDANFECKCSTCEKGSPRFLKGMTSLSFLELVFLLRDQLPNKSTLWMPQTKSVLENKASLVILSFIKGVMKGKFL